MLSFALFILLMLSNRLTEEREETIPINQNMNCFHVFLHNVCIFVSSCERKGSVKAYRSSIFVHNEFLLGLTNEVGYNEIARLMINLLRNWETVAAARPRKRPRHISSSFSMPNVWLEPENSATLLCIGHAHCGKPPFEVQLFDSVKGRFCLGVPAA